MKGVVVIEASNPFASVTDLALQLRLRSACELMEARICNVCKTPGMHGVTRSQPAYHVTSAQTSGPPFHGPELNLALLCAVHVGLSWASGYKVGGLSPGTIMPHIK